MKGVSSAAGASLERRVLRLRGEMSCSSSLGSIGRRGVRAGAAAVRRSAGRPRRHVHLNMQALGIFAAAAAIFVIFGVLNFLISRRIASTESRALKKRTARKIAQHQAEEKRA